MKLSLENCIELVTGKGTWHTRNCGGKVPRPFTCPTALTGCANRRRGCCKITKAK